MNIDNVLYLLWLLRILKPEWILSYYVPGIGFVKGLPTVLLYLTVLYAIMGRRKFEVDKSTLFFFLAMLISTPFALNSGLARLALGGVFDTLLFLALNAVVTDKDRHIGRVFKLYGIVFAFYSVTGILNKGLVPFHVFLSNEDAFGPFMDIGVPLFLFLAFQGGRVKSLYIVAGLLGIIGLVASFARGAFLALCASVLYIWYKSSRKFLAAWALAVIGLGVGISANILFEGGRYWSEMATIKESAADEEEGRHWLWRKAIEIFLENPIIGVGPFNYGPALYRTVAHDGSQDLEMPIGFYYTRVPHNIYFQMLAEIGVLGITCFAGMIAVFWRRNSKIQGYYRERLAESNHTEPLPIRKYYYHSLALNGAMVAFLVNGLFYDILYYHWFFDLIIIGYLVDRRFSSVAAETECGSGSLNQQL